MTPIPIRGRSPDCPDCGAQMQHVPARAGQSVFRCPWVTEARWRYALTAGVTVASCDWPMRDRNPEGLPPYREDRS